MAEEGLEDTLEDEVWENQKWDGSNSAWVAAEERGRFSDRFGRFKFTSLDSVFVPKNSRVVEDWRLAEPTEPWHYARTFGALEADLAKGVLRTEKKWNSMVRWRRYIRKRKLEAASAEILSGWLGSRERRGTWKSRYFVLLGGSAACAVAGSSTQGTGFESEDESSNDEGDEGDEGDDDSRVTGHALHAADDDGSPSGGIVDVRQQYSPAEMTRSLEKPSSFSDLKSGEESAYTPVLFYFRRNFSDSRTIFPGSFDLNELRKFSKRQVRIMKFSNRTKVDDSLWTPDYPGRFTLKISAARKRVLNAVGAEARERWVDTIRTMIEGGVFEGAVSPTGKRHGPLSAAFRVAKRGQQELRKGLGGLRRGSQSGNAPPIILSTMITSTPLAVPMHSPSGLSASAALFAPPPIASLPPSALGIDLPTFRVELMRSPLEGALNLRLREAVPGNGLIIEQVHEQARDARTGAFPLGINVGDTLVAVQGETIVGLEKGRALKKLKEVLSKFPIHEKVVLTLTRQPVRRNSTMSNESPLVPLANPQYSPRSQSKQAAAVNTEQKPVAIASNGSFDSIVSGQTNLPLRRSESENSEASVQRPFHVCKIIDVPQNTRSITSEEVKTATQLCLEQMISSGPVTYAHLRREVARQFQMQEEMDSDAWRLYFRNILDFSLCDGVKYSVGGLDMSDFTPVILKVQDDTSTKRVLE